MTSEEVGVKTNFCNYLTSACCLDSQCKFYVSQTHDKSGVTRQAKNHVRATGHKVSVAQIREEIHEVI